jgi:hypothetical protein
MKQTAVEWLVEEMIKKGFFDTNKPLTFTNLEHLQNQAKEMEKQQIENAYANGHNDGCRYMNNEKQVFEHAEQYYNETFNK